MIKRFFAFVLSLAMMISVLPVGAITAFAAETDEISIVSEESPVAKVGNTEYATIDEAIAAWTNNTTLTLLADVTLSDVIKLSSTEYHILDLGTYTMTAASKKDAIQIENNARSSASYTLDIKADATNPGGITASGSGKAIVRTAGKSGVKDRPIIRFYNGVFNASNIVYHSGSNGTNCPQFQFHGGEYNGTIRTNRSLNQFYGGTFTGNLMMSVDSSAYTLVAGGRFKYLSNSMGSNLDEKIAQGVNNYKFTIGSAKATYDKEVYVDDEGYYVVTNADPVQGIEATVEMTPDGDNYFYYSKVPQLGMKYTNAEVALEKNKTATITVYADELDMTDISFTGTIFIPMGERVKITNAPSDLKTDTVDGYEVVCVDGVYYSVVKKNYVAQIGDTKYESLRAAIDDANTDDTITFLADITEDVTIFKAVTIDGAKKNYTGTMNIGTVENITIQNVNFVKGCIDGNTSALSRKLTVKDCTFDGVDKSINYAITVRHGASVVIENSSAENYSIGMLYVPQSVAAITVKDVTVSNVQAAFNITYSGDALFENVAFENVTYGIHFQIYGSRTYTVKNSDLSGATNPFWFWDKSNGTEKVTVVFEGENIVPGFQEISYTTSGVLKLATGASLTAPEGLTITTDAEGYEVVYENGIYSVAAKNYVAQIGDTKYESLQAAIDAAATGDTIKLIDNILLNDINDVEARLAASNGNGKYCGFDYGNGAFFNVIAKDLTVDLNGCTITYDIHDDAWCNKRVVSIFYVTDKAKLTIKDSSEAQTGAVTVYGMATAVYSVAVDTEVTIEGGTWTWYECKTCGATNAFLYASHGGELYVTDGVFVNNVEGDAGDYMFLSHYSSTETKENSAGVDYDQTKIAISGGTFENYNPGEIKYMDNGDKNKETLATGCAEGFVPVENTDGSYGVKVWYDEAATTLYINNIYDLMAFAAEANSGNNFSGKTVELTADIDLDGMTWTPIASFAGNFVGNNKTIKNFHIEAIDARGGFFNVIEESNGLEDVKVKDLILSDVTATVGNNRFGTLANSIKGVVHNVTVKNVTVTTTHTGAWVGGMAAFMSWPWMTNCTVENLTVNAQAGADLIGGFACILQKNSNHVFDNLDVKGFKVIVNDTDASGCGVGGFVAQTQRGWENPKVINCDITGIDVTASGLVDVGGFIAWPGAHTIAENCTTEGKIDVTGVTSEDCFAGGFFGNLGWNADLGKMGHVVTNSSANVDIITKVAAAGGFVGSATNSNNNSMYATFTNCSATGDITCVEDGTADIGGFAGDADRGVYNNCTASGTVTNNGTGYAGQFAGALYDVTPKYDTRYPAGTRDYLVDKIAANGCTYTGDSTSLDFFGYIEEVDLKIAVAKIGNEYYESLADAVKAVAENTTATPTTITLLKDQTIRSLMVGHTYPQNIIIDLNGYTLSSTDKTLTAYRAGTTLTLINGTVSGNSTGGTIQVTYGGKLVLGEGLTVKGAGGSATLIKVDNGGIVDVCDTGVPFVGGKVDFGVSDDANNKVNVAASIGRTYYGTLAGAVTAAATGDTVVLLKDIALTEADCVVGADRKVLVDVVGKDITLDMNGKKISVEHLDAFTNDYIVAVIRVADGAGLTVTGNGTIDVKLKELDPDMAYMFWKRGTTGHLTVENGTFHMNDSADSMVYTNGNEIVNIKGGTWTLDAYGTRGNREPWIFNVQGAGDNHVLVTGGTFNADINRQHWSNEVVVPETYYTVNNGDGTWTVKEGAVAYVYTGMLTGPYFIPKNIGYATLEEAIAAAENYSDPNVTLLADSAVDLTIKKEIILDLNDFAFTGKIALADANATLTAPEGLDVTIDTNLENYKDYKIVYENGVYKVDKVAAVVIKRAGSTLSYEDLIYVIDIFGITLSDDYTNIDLSQDAGILVWTPEEYAAMKGELVFDADKAIVGLKPYSNKAGYYYGTSEGIFTRNLANDAYYCGYVKLADGTYVFSEAKLYGPSVYAYTMINKETTSAKTKELCVALLNYISAAQKYFYGTADDALANKDLSAEQKAISWDISALNRCEAVPSDKQITRDEIFQKAGKNLKFDDMISVGSIYVIDDAIIDSAESCGTIFWTAEQFGALTGVPSLENFGEGTKIEGMKEYQNTKNHWYSAAPKIAAKDMADTEYYMLGYVVDADGKAHYSDVMAYSVEEYIYNTINKGNASEEMQNFAKRLFVYERAANAALSK